MWCLDSERQRLSAEYERRSWRIVTLRETVERRAGRRHERHRHCDRRIERGQYRSYTIGGHDHGPAVIVTTWRWHLSDAGCRGRGMMTTRRGRSGVMVRVARRRALIEGQRQSDKRDGQNRCHASSHHPGHRSILAQLGLRARERLKRSWLVRVGKPVLRCRRTGATGTVGDLLFSHRNL
jgi:hypothetical protein